MKEIDIYSVSPIGTWINKDIGDIYEQLEKPNWAPWLSAPVTSLARRASVFPEGQIVIENSDGKLCASLSINRINWNGNIDELPSWDDVAGDPTTYERTYVSDGNTLCLMSMNVNPNFQGQGYAKTLISEAKKLGERLGVQYVIGSFRPNEYGKHKLERGVDALAFDDYAVLTRTDGLPEDAWLRNLSRNGMKHLKVDTKAMVVPVTLEEFEGYKDEYHQGQWVEVEDNSWECGEVGTWHVDVKNNTAVYIESNMWGIIWQKTGSQ